MSRDPWTTCNIASVQNGGEEASIRVATDGNRIRIRCSDLRFDPPIEMDVSDFAAIMRLALAVGVAPSPVVEVKVERLDLKSPVPQLDPTSEYNPNGRSESEWAEWYGGPESLPWPTTIGVHESNLRKAFTAGFDSMRMLCLKLCEKHAATQVDNGAFMDCVEDIRAL